MLANVKVADLAVGSGAFPLGMLNEIVRARQVLTEYLAIEMNGFQKKTFYAYERKTYDLKVNTIKNCIFACDIEPSAVDIAKLRLWLSIVIDDEIADDAGNGEFDAHTKPRQLPNLDCNIICGNSLIDEFNGIKLIKESELLNNVSQNSQSTVFQWSVDGLIRKLIELQDKLFFTKEHTDKEEIKAQIQKIYDEIILEQIGGNYSLRDAYYATQSESSKPFILWQLYFPKVFKENGGFDVVIGNPPYVGEKGHKEMFQEIAATSFGEKFYYGKVDLFYFFFHKGLDLARDNGQVALITTNYFITALGAHKLRADFIDRSSIKKLINFNELKIFQSALGQHNMITMIEKTQTKGTVSTITTNRNGFANVDLLNAILYGKDEETEYFSFEQDKLYEGEENYMRLSGVGNEDNPLESVFSKMTHSYKYLGDICAVNIGMRTGADKLSESYIQKYSIDLPKNTGIYVLTSEEVRQLELSDYEKSFLVPWYKNSDISQYTCKQKNDLWLIDLSFPKQKNVNFDEIPNIKEHINQFKAVLENRRSNDNGLQAVLKNGYWWAFTMRQIDFTAPKIVAPQRSKANTFGYNEIPWYASMDVYFITNRPDFDIDLKYVLGLLNSKLFYVWLYNKGKRKGESLELYQKPLSEVPIYIASDDVQNKIKLLVDEILEDSSKKKFCMKEIDDIVYEMYKLTDEEIQIIESQMEG